MVKHGAHRGHQVGTMLCWQAVRWMNTSSGHQGDFQEMARLPLHPDVFGGRNRRLSQDFLSCPPHHSPSVPSAKALMDFSYDKTE